MEKGPESVGLAASAGGGDTGFVGAGCSGEGGTAWVSVDDSVAGAAGAEDSENSGVGVGG